MQNRFHKNTHNDAIIKLDMKENAILTFSLGEMNVTCPLGLLKKSCLILLGSVKSMFLF